MQIRIGIAIAWIMFHWYVILSKYVTIILFEKMKLPIFKLYLYYFRFLFYFHFIFPSEKNDSRFDLTFDKLQ